MILTLLGGGGFRVPLVFQALLADESAGRVTELRLHDVDESRLAAIGTVVDELAGRHPDPPRVVRTTSLADAIRGTDFVFSAIRVGGTAGRAADESLCLGHGVIGQETVGAGGISYALRGIPVALEIARTVREVAPQAWVINFTNPAGIITQAMREVLGDRVIGICDSPVGLARRVLEAAQHGGIVKDPDLRVELGGDRVRPDYLGLNHLGWLRGLHVDGQDVLPEVIARADLVEGFEEGRLFGAPLVQLLGAVPNEYLHYYYCSREALAADAAADEPRGRFLLRQQGGFYDAVGRAESSVEAFELWQQVRMERERTYMATNRQASGDFERDPRDMAGGGYDRVALAIMHAIANDVPADLILNVANQGTIPELADEDVIELPCRIDASGVKPLPTAGLADHALGLVLNAKFVERMTIIAGRDRSRNHALLALLQHPLVDSWQVAQDLLDGMIEQWPELADLA
ncbi:6-phospho-beta-glucosidase [Luteococcus sp. Sow4_B9]|uniref:6-phospho-beta-glucosidase n=1 Tax=Luteococcus sp. Sow4_B9 TaxID=3438792 RepID=UPI003F9A6ABA